MRTVASAVVLLGCRGVTFERRRRAARRVCVVDRQRSMMDDNNKGLKLASSQKDYDGSSTGSFVLSLWFVYTARRLPSNVAEPASRIAIIATARYHMTAATTTTTRHHHLRRVAAVAPTTAVSLYPKAYHEGGGWRGGTTTYNNNETNDDSPTHPYTHATLG